MAHANRTHRPKFKLEYLTYALPSLRADLSGDAINSLEGDELQARYPVPLKELPRSLRNGTRTKSRYAPYGLPDLTVGAWMKLGRRLGNAKHTKLRRRFAEFMYMGGEEE